MKFDLRKGVIILTVITVTSLFIAGIFFLMEYNTQKNGISVQNRKTKNVIMKDESLEGIGDIIISVSSCDINLESSDLQAIHSEFSYFNGRKNFNPYIEYRKEGTKLYLTLKYDNSLGFNLTFFEPEQEKLSITVPQTYSGNIFLKSSSGDVNCHELSLNDFECHLSSGTIKIADLAAENFLLVSSSGNIYADNLTVKNGTLSSSSGNIKLSEITGDFKIRCTSGSTLVIYREFSNNLEIKSSSGDIRIKLPGNSKFKLTAKTSSGNIRCSLPITISGNVSDNRLSGFIGESDNAIYLEASSGDVIIDTK